MKKILLTVFLLLFSNASFAQEVDKSEQVKVFVSEVGNQIIKIAADKKLSAEQRKAKIINVIDQSIDADWIARFVLAKNYKNASEEQRKKFAQLYREFMINTYGPKFQNYNGRKFDVISVAKEASFYVAKSEFLPQDSKTPIDVSFRVKEKNTKLVILDFIAEGVSLIETQRSEFNSAISQKGMDQFLEDLKVRIEKLKSQKN